MSTPLNGSVLKAFSILRLITPERREISAAIVASELSLNTATAHRFLMTLEKAGALVSYRRGHFSLGGQIEELGRLAEETNPLAARIQPLIADLSRELGESVMACRLSRTGPICIAVAAADRPISVSINVGTVLPMASTAQGKLFLADMDEQERAGWLGGTSPPAPRELERIRRDGFARNRGDNEPDIGAVSVPVRGTGGRISFTLSVFGMLSRFDEAMAGRAMTALNRAARSFQAARD